MLGGPVNCTRSYHTQNFCEEPLERMEIGPHHLIFSTIEETVVLLIEEIIHIKAEGSYTWLFCENGIKHMLCKNIGAFEVGLSRERHFRCHDSHIVDLTKVLKVLKSGGARAVMTNGSEIPIARRSMKNFMAALQAA